MSRPVPSVLCLMVTSENHLQHWVNISTLNLKVLFIRKDVCAASEHLMGHF